MYVVLEQRRDILRRPWSSSQVADAFCCPPPSARTSSRWRSRRTAAPLFPSNVSDTLKSWMRGLHRQPAYALNGLWDIVAWNDAACEMFGGTFHECLTRSRNVLKMIFCWRPVRDLFANWY
jgi:PAS domain-containing protein